MKYPQGGFSYGQDAAVIHTSRTDIDSDEDVPLMPFPTEGTEKVTSWTVKQSGHKLFHIEGETWRNEWIEPGSYSPRIRGDTRPSPVQFIVDAAGNLESCDALVEGGRWLWFRPDVIMALAHRRGGALSWYTRDTGSITCSPHNGVHFGMNQIGLVNVYAKDVAVLPEWQQRIWAGFNIPLDGGVSTELLASQVQAKPANTQAPEPFLGKGLQLLNELSAQYLSFPIIRQHDEVPEILERTHRFRAIDRAGLFALAKDIARLTADSIDASAINDYLSISKKKRLGSLKSLEKLMAKKITSERAHFLMGPLVGAYEMRQGDAHLAGSGIDEAFRLVNINPNLPHVIQGFQLIHSSVSSIWAAIKVLRDWTDPPSKDVS